MSSANYILLVRNASMCGYEVMEALGPCRRRTRVVEFRLTVQPEEASAIDEESRLITVSTSL